MTVFRTRLLPIFSSKRSFITALITKMKDRYYNTTICNKISCQRNVASKSLSGVLPSSEGKTLAFPHPPSPPCNVVPLYKLSVIR